MLIRDLAQSHAYFDRLLVKLKGFGEPDRWVDLRFLLRSRSGPDIAHGVIVHRERVDRVVFRQIRYSQADGSRLSLEKYTVTRGGFIVVCEIGLETSFVVAMDGRFNDVELPEA